MAISPKLLQHLEREGVAFDIVRHPHSETSMEAADSSSIDPEHLAKAVLLEDASGMLLVVVPASHWVTLERINQQLERNLELSPESRVDTLFDDCVLGAVPPFGAVYRMDTLVDEMFRALAYVYFESGDHEQLLVVSQQGFAHLMREARWGHFCRMD